MVLKFYAIKDNVVGAYMNPVALHNDAECIRAVKEAMQAEKGEIYNRASDLSMYYLYSLDFESGLIVDNTPAFICNLIDYKESENNNE